jgi:hypothetical protein
VNLTSPSDFLAIYAALGGVAAITIALQAATALMPLSQSDDIAQRGRANPAGTPGRTDLQRDARRFRRSAWLLTIGGVTINAAVLASWGFVAFAKVQPTEWFLWLPFVAVTAAFLYLIVVSGVGIKRLNDGTR